MESFLVSLSLLAITRIVIDPILTYLDILKEIKYEISYISNRLTNMSENEVYYEEHERVRKLHAKVKLHRVFNKIYNNTVFRFKKMKLKNEKRFDYNLIDDSGIEDVLLIISNTYPVPIYDKVSQSDCIKANIEVHYLIGLVK